MSWQDDLLKKSEELKIKEEKNVRHSIPPVSADSRNSNRSSRDVHSVSIHKKITNERRKNSMIPAKGLFEDYEAIDKESIGAAEKVWKMIPKLIKIVLNCRTNTARIMEKLGIPLEEIKKKETK